MSAFGVHLLNVPHVVYRCFSADGDLLYVGVTHDIEQRIYQHRLASNPSRASNHLREHMARYETEEYPDRPTARAAEAEVIRTERPLLNVIHNRRRAAA